MKKQVNSVKLLIIGAGKAGELLANDIQAAKASAFEVVGFIDDDSKKRGKLVAHLPVLGDIDSIHAIAKQYDIDEVLIAIPSGRGETIRRIVANTTGLKLSYKILPRQADILLQKYDKDYLQHVREVKPEDLLGGEISKLDQEDVKKYIHGKTVMVTGAAGSIGSELSRQIIAYNAKTVILYDWWENGIFDLQNKLKELQPDIDVRYYIGDVKNRRKIQMVIDTHHPDIIYHAAAYKHVPLMEYMPSESVMNNIIGTKCVAEAAILGGVKKFVLISTDKAVNPTNIMGATKRAAEKVIHILSQSQSTTMFCAVRFGNVINSNGSAIPFFERQIDKGGPVTVTHREITRFFMTIPEAVHLVLQASVMGENNDLFVLDMGESVKIYDLARLLIALRGYVPEDEIAIEIVGLRPGEKLYEEVLVEQEEVASTPVKKVFRTKNYHDFNQIIFLYNLSLIVDEISDSPLDVDKIRSRLKQMVSTYHPAKH